MKFFYASDWHLRTSTPACRKDKDFYQVQLTKLRRVIQMARDYDVDCVLHGGDFFDSHDPGHRLMYDTMAILNNSHVRWIITPGNHDMFGANPDTLQRSGLGILHQGGVVETCKDSASYGMKGTVIRTVAYKIPYTERDFAFDNKQKDMTYILIVHDMLTTHFVPFPHTLLKDVKTNADLVLCGHWHAQFSEEHNGVWFLNPGPLTRQTVTEAHVDPGVFLVETDVNAKQKIKATFLPLNAAPADQVIDYTHAGIPGQEGLAEQFLQTLRASSLESLDRQGLIRQVGEAGKFPPEVIQNGLTRLSEAEKVLELA